MCDHRSLGEAGETPTCGLGDIFAKLREAAKVKLIEDRAVPWNSLPSGLGRERRQGDALGNERRAVGASLEQRGMQSVRAVDRRGIGIGEQFRGVEAVTVTGIERAINAQSVPGAGAHAGDEATVDVRAAAGQQRARDLAFALLVIEAEIYSARVRGKDADVGAPRLENDSERRGRVHFAASVTRDRKRVAYRLAGPRQDTSARIPLRRSRRIAAASRWIASARWIA